MSAADRQPPYYLGIDLGGTNIKSGVVDDVGQPLSSVSHGNRGRPWPGSRHRQPCRGGPARRVGERPFLERDHGSRAGLAGHDGLADAGCSWNRPTCRDGISYRSATCWPGSLDKQTVLQNDANAAAYGEYWAGAGRNTRSLVLFTLGTGIGCGIVDEGRIIEGRHSHGAECGHIIIQMENARQCSCGGYGHLEAYASATALVKRALEALAHDRSPAF